jgi:H+/Cl- antiporter ClcA
VNLQTWTAVADVANPGLPLPPTGTWTTWLVVLICVVAVVAVAFGVYFLQRARIKRRASGPGSDR